MLTIRLARQAMGSRWELVLRGDDGPWLRAAGEAALAEIERLDRRLSTYQATSEVSRLNATAHRAPARVTPALFDLLRRARDLHAATDGAFDLTVGPLMQAWGFVRERGRLPEAGVLDAARARTGFRHVRLDADARTVSFTRPGVGLDLGGIGKGYAVDEALRLLRETGVEHAFLHGGTSAVGALGHSDDGRPWKVAVEHPDADEALAVVALSGGSLSVSAVWGKAFEAGGRRYGHVLDPRRGEPVEGAYLAAVALEAATEADALSTALLVLGPSGLARLARRFPDLRALLLVPGPGGRGRRLIDHGLIAS